MAQELSALERLGLSLEGVIEECRRWGADPHEVIAIALSTESRENAKETGMTLREQSRLAFDLINKAVPSKQAIKHSGDADNPLVFTFSSDDEAL